MTHRLVGFYLWVASVSLYWHQFKWAAMTAIGVGFAHILYVKLTGGKADEEAF